MTNFEHQFVNIFVNKRSASFRKRSDDSIYIHNC